MFIDFETYDLALLLFGLATLGVVALPRLLHEHQVSFPLVFLTLGAAVFWLPLPFEPIDAPANPLLVERVTELTLIVALMGIGLKIDRPFSWRAWAATWRLLAITMPLTILGGALLGSWLVGLPVAAALLLGTTMAPTDPVLASDVQSGEPLQTEEEDRVRFGLTSEAGLNDGLAFPFVNAAIAVALASGINAAVVGQWVAIAVGLKLSVGVVAGLLLGRAVAWLVFQRTLGRTELAQTSEGLVALAVTFLTYGIAEWAQGYGFLAVFVAGLTIRHYEREHEYHQVLHRFTDQTECLLLAVFLILLGGAIVDGLLDGITWQMATVACLILLVVRPLTTAIAFLGHRGDWRETALLGFFGIRGVGSMFYLAFAVEQATFGRERDLWAIVGLVVVLSLVLHGLTATPFMQRFDRWRRQQPPPADVHTPRHETPPRDDR